MKEKKITVEEIENLYVLHKEEKVLVEELLNNVTTPFTVSLHNGDILTIYNEYKAAIKFSEQYIGDFHRQLKKQLDYSLEYADDRNNWITYLLWKYEDEWIEYTSDQKYRDKHSPKQSGFITEQMTNCFESTLNSFAEYIDMKKFDNEEHAVQVMESKAILKEMDSLIKNAVKEEDYKLAQSLVLEKQMAEQTVEMQGVLRKNTERGTREVPLALSMDVHDKENRVPKNIADKVDENGTISRHNLKDYMQKQQIKIQETKKKDKNDEKSLKNAVSYLERIYSNLDTLPRVVSPAEHVSREVYARNFDLNKSAADFRSELLKEVIEDFYVIEKYLGRVNYDLSSTSKEDKEKREAELREKHGFGFKKILDMRNSIKGDIHFMIDAMLVVLRSNDEGKLYHGDLDLLYLGDVRAYKAIIANFEGLHIEAKKTPDNNLKWLLWYVDELLHRTLKNSTEASIINWLRQGYNHYEIYGELKKNNIEYSRRSITKFLSETLPERLLDTYKKDLDDYVYTYVLPGKYKTCKGNNKVYLATERYFGKKKDNKDGLKHYSKEYEKFLR